MHPTLTCELPNNLAPIFPGPSAVMVSGEQNGKNTSQVDYIVEISSLLNEEDFKLRLKSETERAKRFKDAFSIILVNIDKLSQINHHMGNKYGNDVIQFLAKDIKLPLRGIDIVGKRAGGEFIILLPKTNHKQALIVGHKLHNALNSKCMDIGKQSGKITASIGISSYPEHLKFNSCIVRDVEYNLKSAKSNGPNSVFGYSITPTFIPAGPILKKSIRHAITENRVKLFLQPIVNANTWGVFAYEALARINEDGVDFPPSHFIEHAEGYALIKEIDQCIFKNGILKIKELNPISKMFFNFSPATFHDTSWMSSIPELIKAAEVAPNRIVIEITEREKFHDIEALKNIINELRVHGIEFALDDFGSGYSSFMYMREFPVNYLKIDGSLIRHLMSNKSDQIIVNGIQQIAQQFGMQTIAEFVEDTNTLEILTSIGINFAQGHQFSEAKCASIFDV